MFNDSMSIKIMVEGWIEMLYHILVLESKLSAFVVCSIELMKFTQLTFLIIHTMSYYK